MAGAAHDLWGYLLRRPHTREHPLVDNRVIEISRRGPCELRIFLVADLCE